MAEMPEMTPYARHVLICTGPFCDAAGKAQAIYQRLGQRLIELGMAEYHDPERIKRGVTACLGVCGGGPLLVVYPEGVWYCQVDEERLERIIQEHLREGRPVEEYIFYRMQPNEHEE